MLPFFLPNDEIERREKTRMDAHGSAGATAYDTSLSMSAAGSVGVAAARAAAAVAAAAARGGGGGSGWVLPSHGAAGGASSNAADDPGYGRGAPFGPFISVARGHSRE